MIRHQATDIADNGPTLVRFGYGDIIISVVQPVGCGIGFGIALSNTTEPDTPGTDRPEYNGKTTKELCPKVLMTFTQAASFDSLISRLQLAKKAFLQAQPKVRKAPKKPKANV